MTGGACLANRWAGLWSSIPRIIELLRQGCLTCHLLSRCGGRVPALGMSTMPLIRPSQGQHESSRYTCRGEKVA
jgi:hypothetical protein